MFKKTVYEAKHETKKSETWSAELDGFDVYVHRDDDDSYDVGIYPNDWRGEFGQDHMRLSLVKFYPKNVAEFDALAERLPAVLRQLAELMRAEGLNDLRSSFDRQRDEWDVRRKQILESFRAADAVDPHAADTGKKATRV